MIKQRYLNCMFFFNKFFTHATKKDLRSLLKPKFGNSLSLILHHNAEFDSQHWNVLRPHLIIVFFKSNFFNQSSIHCMNMTTTIDCFIVFVLLFPDLCLIPLLSL